MTSKALFLPGDALLYTWVDIADYYDFVNNKICVADLVDKSQANKFPASIQIKITVSVITDLSGDIK